MEYKYNCVYPQDLDELNFILDNMKEIKPSTFLSKVSLKSINNALMYNIYYKNRKELENDWSVRFYSIHKSGIYTPDLNSTL